LDWVILWVFYNLRDSMILTKPILSWAHLTSLSLLLLMDCWLLFANLPDFHKPVGHVANSSRVPMEVLLLLLSINSLSEACWLCHISHCSETLRANISLSRELLHHRGLCPAKVSLEHLWRDLNCLPTLLGCMGGHCSPPAAKKLVELHGEKNVYQYDCRNKVILEFEVRAWTVGG